MDIIERDITAIFSAIERKSTKMGLAVNDSKTKYMLSTSRGLRRVDSQITADYYTVKEFIFLCCAINTKNDDSLEIKRRITRVKRCCNSLNK